MRFVRSPATGTIDWTFALSLAFLGVVAGVALLAPLLPLRPYTEMGTVRLGAPALVRWLGTDQFGRDILARVVYGARTSLTVALVGVATATVFGVALGLAAGFIGRALDTVIMRVMDAMLAFPSLLLAIGVTAVMGPSAMSAAIAVGIVGIPQMARVVRAATLAEREAQYVDAARTVGVGGAAIVVRHILPNILAPITVQVALFFVVAVLTEAGLSFLGLGVQVPLPSLGSMLNESRAYMSRAPWFSVAPGAVLTLIVLAMNLVADGLRDRLDPRR